jgi:acetolactate synthase-1/2/3 large subunit
MVRQWQELFYDSRYSGTSFAPFQPDFVKVADAWGMPGVSVDRAEDLEAGLLATLNADGPALININVDPIAKVFPMVPQGEGPGAVIVKG